MDPEKNPMLNGNFIDIYADEWILREITFKGLSLLSIVGSIILSIPLVKSEIEDKFFWHCDKRGTFTLGYKLVMQKNGWKNLWYLDIHDNVNIFMWRTCLNTISVNPKPLQTERKGVFAYDVEEELNLKLMYCGLIKKI